MVKSLNELVTPVSIPFYDLWLVHFFFFYFSFTLPECCVGMITTIDEQSMGVTSMGLAHCVSQAAKQLS